VAHYINHAPLASSRSVNLQRAVAPYGLVLTQFQQHTQHTTIISQSNIFSRHTTQHFNQFKKTLYYGKYLKIETWYANHTVDENDFEIFRVLGRGGFGLVNGCRFTRTGKMYAMKTMDKRRVKLNKGAKMCSLEKDLMSICKR